MELELLLAIRLLGIVSDINGVIQILTGMMVPIFGRKPGILSFQIIFIMPMNHIVLALQTVIILMTVH